MLEPELCRAALPYGLATNLWLGHKLMAWPQTCYWEMRKEARALNYNAKYTDAVNACMRLRPEPVVDIYGGNEE